VAESRPLYFGPHRPTATPTDDEDRNLITRRHVFYAAAAVAAAPLFNRVAWAQEPLPDMVMGDPDAPVEIIEYSSMTCPHCAAFHTETLPTIKERYIDTGKAKLVFREFPLDRVALNASAIARCAGEDSYFSFVDVLYRTQNQWAHAADPTAELKKIVHMGGLDPAMVDTCLEDQSIIDGILAVRLNGDQTYEIRSTPTFIIDGETHAGQMTVEEFEAILEPHLAED
jgi:protein-disulfide isomerase